MQRFLMHFQNAHFTIDFSLLLPMGHFYSKILYSYIGFKRRVLASFCIALVSLKLSLFPLLLQQSLFLCFKGDSKKKIISYQKSDNYCYRYSGREITKEKAIIERSKEPIPKIEQ